MSGNITDSDGLKDSVRTDIVFGSTKTYKATTSTAFRQWRAKSHCRFLHGYSLEFSAKFEAVKLDDRNWVVDFGSLKPFKQWLEDTFDHTVIVASDDPHLDWYKAGAQLGVLVLRMVNNTGCESAALLALEALEAHLQETSQADRVRVVEVRCDEHHANGAYVRLKNSNHPDFIGWDRASGKEI